MRVKWLRKALQNLNDEAEFIARNNPASAKILVQRILDSIDLLSTNPYMGNAGRIHGTRELIIPDTRYLIPYRVRPNLNLISTFINQLVTLIFQSPRQINKFS
jgi:toxin ParE1/3/4